MSKTSMMALARAEAIIISNGVKVDLFQYMGELKSRRGTDGKFMWRSADALATLIIDSAANAYTENSVTRVENEFSDQAEAINCYIQSNLDSWDQKDFSKLNKTLKGEISRLRFMVEINEIFESKQ